MQAVIKFEFVPFERDFLTVPFHEDNMNFKGVSEAAMTGFDLYSKSFIR